MNLFAIFWDNPVKSFLLSWTPEHTLWRIMLYKITLSKLTISGGKVSRSLYGVLTLLFSASNITTSASSLCLNCYIEKKNYVNNKHIYVLSYYHWTLSLQRKNKWHKLEIFMVKQNYVIKENIKTPK